MHRPLFLYQPHLLTFFCFLLLNNGANASSSYTATPIIDGLMLPWSIEFIDAETAIISERQGTIKLLRLNPNAPSNQTTRLIEVDLSQIQIDGLPFAQTLFTKGQGGLLDIRISPKFAQDQHIFLTYSRSVQGSKGGATTLASAVLKGVPLKPKLEQFEQLKTSDVINTSGRHFGSRIAFDQQGHIFFSIGDRGTRAHGQDPSTLAAVIVRLNLDGSTPKDNPFKAKNLHDYKTRGEVFSFGHRNPQGLYFDDASQTLFASEHGPRGGDEINIIRAGANYGWAEVSFGKEYWGPIQVGEATERDDVTAPITVYTPSIGPSGLIRVQGEQYPNLKGMLISGALAIPQLSIIGLDEKLKQTSQKALFRDLNQRVRDITQSPEGLIYFITDNGNLYRVDRRD